ncbi:MAG TPA: MarR family transcriptional regulator [Nocardioidaceae bacterium]|nr:MarR family transcriptional regulator [Nocardioidaceae bacterium]
MSELRIERDLAFLVSVVGRMAHASTSRAVAATGLQAVDLLTLQLLATRGRVLSATLAQLLGVQPSAVTPVTTRLVSAGLISREQDRCDRRRWWLTLTAQGRDTLNQAYDLLDDDVFPPLTALTDDDRERLVDLLGSVLTHAGGGSS